MPPAEIDRQHLEQIEALDKAARRVERCALRPSPGGSDGKTAN